MTDFEGLNKFIQGAGGTYISQEGSESVDFDQNVMGGLRGDIDYESNTDVPEVSTINNTTDIPTETEWVNYQLCKLF